MLKQYQVVYIVFFNYIKIIHRKMFFFSSYIKHLTFVVKCARDFFKRLQSYKHFDNARNNLFRCFFRLLRYNRYMYLHMQGLLG